MITRKTIIDRIEINRDGVVNVRLGLILEEDGTEISSKWHRLVLTGGEAISERMAAVNTHLQRQREAPVAAAEIAKLGRVVQAVRDQLRAAPAPAPRP